MAAEAPDPHHGGLGSVGKAETALLVPIYLGKRGDSKETSHIDWFGGLQEGI